MANPPAPDTVVVEAASVEEALAMVSAELGPGARIVRADRVRRGGFAGFFTREMVELEAEPAGRAGPAGGVDAALARMLGEAEEASFAEVLGRRLGPAPAALPDEPPTAVDRAPTADATPGVHRPDAAPGVRWDAGLLLEAGLPRRVVETVASLDPADDLAHIAAIAAAVAPACGPLPEGPVRLAGRRAGRLREAATIETGDGPLHLVVGDDDLPEQLAGLPDVVSWVTERGAARAVSLALSSGAVLGYGMSASFGAPARRVTPVDVALALRELMER